MQPFFFWSSFCNGLFQKLYASANWPSASPNWPSDSAVAEALGSKARESTCGGSCYGGLITCCIRVLGFPWSLQPKEPAWCCVGTALGLRKSTGEALGGRCCGNFKIVLQGNPWGATQANFFQRNLIKQSKAEASRTSPTARQSSSLISARSGVAG